MSEETKQAILILLAVGFGFSAVAGFVDRIRKRGRVAESGENKNDP